MSRLLLTLLTALSLLFSINTHAQNDAPVCDPACPVGARVNTVGDTQQADDADLCTPTRFETVWVQTDFCNSIVDFGEVLSVIPPDAIPAIDDPIMQTIEEADFWLSELSPVIAVEIDGEARAYPQAVLVFHEIANDTLADVPIAVTYCPLCNSSIVFDRRINDETLNFGVSGNLRNSDLIMFDRTTFSWWQQFTGEGLVGDYAGELLDIIPSQVMGFAQFADQYPDGLVMAQQVDRLNYGQIPNHYADYQTPFLFDGQVDDRLPATAHVLATTIDDIAMAYPFDTLADTQVINDTLGETDIVIFWQSGVAAMMDNVVVDRSRDIGTAGLFERTLSDGTVLTFTYDAQSDIITDDQTGSAWNAFGQAIDGELVGTQLTQRIAAPHFWFAWAAFHPETLIYE